MGENLALYTFSNDIKSIDNIEFMKLWFDEYYNYNPNGKSNGSYGHYTQVFLIFCLKVLSDMAKEVSNNL